MKIWILDPYHAGSHRDWSCGVQRVLEMAGHQVTMHTMPGRHWKWRMHAAAAHFASLMGGSEVPDVVVTTDMCDVAQLRGLMPANWNNVQCGHDVSRKSIDVSQWSPTDNDADAWEGPNLCLPSTSVQLLASGSSWLAPTQSIIDLAFLTAAEPWMKRMPKPHIPDLVSRIAHKSDVVRLGLDFPGWDACRSLKRPNHSKPTLLSSFGTIVGHGTRVPKPLFNW